LRACLEGLVLGFGLHDRRGCVLADLCNQRWPRFHASAAATPGSIPTGPAQRSIQRSVHVPVFSIRRVKKMVRRQVRPSDVSPISESSTRCSQCRARHLCRRTSRRLAYLDIDLDRQRGAARERRFLIKPVGNGGKCCRPPISRTTDNVSGGRFARPDIAAAVVAGLAGQVTADRGGPDQWSPGAKRRFWAQFRKLQM